MFNCLAYLTTQMPNEQISMLEYIYSYIFIHIYIWTHLNNLLRKIKFYERAEGPNYVLSYNHVISNSCTCMSAERRRREKTRLGQNLIILPQQTLGFLKSDFVFLSMSKIHLYIQCITDQNRMLLITFSFIKY